MTEAMKIDLPHILQDKDRHGKPRIYVRIAGKPMVRLREPPGSAAFLRAYDAALARMQGGEPVRDAKTLEWLGRKYMASVEFQGFAKRDRANRQGVLDACFDEPTTPGGTARIGDTPLAMLGPAHIRVLRDRKIKEGKPGAANNRLKYVSAMLAWGVENGLVKANPARDVRQASYERKGYHTWTADEVRRAEAAWPIGTKQRAALSILLFLGLRGGDVRTLPWTLVGGPTLRLRAKKTAKHKNAADLELPILPALRRVLYATPKKHAVIIVTEYGQPFSERGFGQWFAQECEKIGLGHCTAHGLRKAGATIAAERGATTKQLMAIYGWTSPQQAETYVRTADRKRLAAGAMGLIVPGDGGEE
jgi:integrase